MGPRRALPLSLGVLAVALSGCAPELEAEGLGHEAEIKATLTVCPGSGDHATISAALAAASDGDTIEVCAGTYYENLSISGIGVCRVLL